MRAFFNKSKDNLSLRIKILSIIGITFVISIIAFYLVTQVLLAQSYLALEDKHIHENLGRLHNTLSNEIDLLTRTSADWGYWTDTSNFVQGLDEEYIESNLNIDTLTNLDFDMMLFFDSERKLFHSSVVNSEKDDLIELDRERVDIFETSEYIFNQESDLVSHDGFITLPDGVFIFSSRPILNSNSEGPRTGTLVIGRYYNEERIQALGESLELPLTYFSLKQPLPAGSPSLLELNTAGTTPLIDRVDENTLQVYTSIVDINGDPTLAIQVNMKRDVYQQGQRSRMILFSILVAATVIILIFDSWLLETQVISRVTSLEAIVSRIRETDDLAVEIPVSGGDEISRLELGFQEMVSALSGSRKKMRLYNEELEQRVQERTADLEVAVKKLKVEITEREQSEYETKIARDQALEALRIKNQILGNVSHDARTPLNVIHLRAELLSMGHYGPLNERQEKMVRTILHSSDELLHFLNNLLEEARAERDTKEITPTYSHLDLALWTAQFYESFEPIAGKRDLDLSIEITPGFSSTIVTDKDWLQQILGNLTSNALKFTNQGKITLRFFNSGENNWSVSVTDTGFGIPSAEHEKIFEPFWQADGSVTRQANRGIGLGLSIVKNLTKMLKGTITLESEPGHGSTFTLTFPVVELEKEKVL